MAELIWPSTQEGHWPSEGYLPPTGDHQYRGLLKAGKGTCNTCGAVYQDGDGRLYDLVKDEHGNIIDRKPASPIHGRPYRAHSYDGSMHPEDVYSGLLNNTLRAHWADWKYGYPHKLYLDGPDNQYAKFYTDRIRDIEHIHTRLIFCKLLAKHTGIMFSIEPDDKLRWQRIQREEK